MRDTRPSTHATVTNTGPALVKQLEEAPVGVMLPEPIALSTSEGTWYLKKITTPGIFPTSVYVVGAGSYHPRGGKLMEATLEFSIGHRHHAGSLDFVI